METTINAHWNITRAVTLVSYIYAIGMTNWLRSVLLTQREGNYMAAMFDDAGAVRGEVSAFMDAIYAWDASVTGVGVGLDPLFRPQVVPGGLAALATALAQILMRPIRVPDFAAKIRPAINIRTAHSDRENGKLGFAQRVPHAPGLAHTDSPAAMWSAPRFSRPDCRMQAELQLAVHQPFFALAIIRAIASGATTPSGFNAADKSWGTAEADSQQTQDLIDAFAYHMHQPAVMHAHTHHDLFALMLHELEHRARKDEALRSTLGDLSLLLQTGADELKSMETVMATVPLTAGSKRSVPPVGSGGPCGHSAKDKLKGRSHTVWGRDQMMVYAELPLRMYTNVQSAESVYTASTIERVGSPLTPGALLSSFVEHLRALQLAGTRSFATIQSTGAMWLSWTEYVNCYAMIMNATGFERLAAVLGKARDVVMDKPYDLAGGPFIETTGDAYSSDPALLYSGLYHALDHQSRWSYTASIPRIDRWANWTGVDRKHHWTVVALPGRLASEYHRQSMFALFILPSMSMGEAGLRYVVDLPSTGTPVLAAYTWYGTARGGDTAWHNPCPTTWPGQTQMPPDVAATPWDLRYSSPQVAAAATAIGPGTHHIFSPTAADIAPIVQALTPVLHTFSEQNGTALLEREGEPINLRVPFELQPGVALAVLDGNIVACYVPYGELTPVGVHAGHPADEAMDAVDLIGTVGASRSDVGRVLKISYPDLPAGGGGVKQA